MTSTGVVIDDDEDILDMTAAFLENLGVRVVGRASDGESGLEQLRQFQPDLAVIDVFLPRMRGIEIVKVIHDRGFRTKAIMISGHLCEEWVIEAVEAGAVSYLTKPFTSEFMHVVPKVLRGEFCLDPWSTRVVAQSLRSRSEARTKLTPAETDVLRLRVNGKCYKEIAVALGKSVKTVEKQTTSLRKKIGAQ
jgi:DNA-binding NarL/FixJ family response regulator